MPLPHRLDAPPAAILAGMVYRPGETPEQAARRQATDLDELRALAWCVQRGRYNRERTRIEGGHRGKAEIVTLTFSLEAADYREAQRAVREIMARG